MAMQAISFSVCLFRLSDLFCCLVLKAVEVCSVDQLAGFRLIGMSPRFAPRD